MTVAQMTKKGLTPFGWVLLAGAGAYFLGSKERRDKAMEKIKGWSGQSSSGATANTKPAA